jgi:predicted ATP-binding protein involved in virulence
MYLKNIIIENNWPIDRLEISEKDLFKENWNPKILILTWKNWSWKTILLSNIVDSFFELAAQNFSDILPARWLWHSYYRVVWWSNQKTWTKHSFSFINFEWKYNEIKEITLENWEKERKVEEILKKYQYLEKTWELTALETQGKTNSLFINDWNWEEWKIVTSVESDKNIKNDFLKNTYCFFPVSRFENPHWLNEWKSESRENINISKKYNWKLNKPIIIENSLNDNKNWILDLFLDFLTDYNKTVTWYDAPDIHFKNSLKEWKNNIEKILSRILQNENVEIKLNLRNNWWSRLKLIDKITKLDLIPSLDNLSWWQSILLNMFASIIRLSDQWWDLNKSINLNQIDWIVLIDEIDLSLHIDLQKEVLPELLSLFPKVQFIITSHSPFFLLWMEEKRKKDLNFQYQIIKMPDWIIDNDILWLEEVEKAYWIFEENFEDFKKEFEELKEKTEEIEKLKPNKVFICEDENWIKVWEHFFAKYWITVDKVISANGCTRFDWEDWFLKTNKISKNPDLKIFRQNDRDGLKKEQVEYIEQKINSEYQEIGYKFLHLPVNEIENLYVLKDDYFSEDLISNKKTELEDSLMWTMSCNFDKFNKQYNCDLFKFSDKSKIINQCRQEADNSIKKYYPWKDIKKLKDNLNIEEEFLKWELVDFPKELEEYLTEIETFFK